MFVRFAIFFLRMLTKAMEFDCKKRNGFRLCQHDDNSLKGENRNEDLESEFVIAGLPSDFLVKL